LTSSRISAEAGLAGHPPFNRAAEIDVDESAPRSSLSFAASAMTIGVENSGKLAPKWRNSSAQLGHLHRLAGLGRIIASLAIHLANHKATPSRLHQAAERHIR